MPAKVMMQSTSPGSWVAPSPATTSTWGQGRKFSLAAAAQARIIFDGDHRHRLDPDDLSQHGAVVPGADADLHDPLARPQVQPIEQARPEAQARHC